MIKNQDAEEEWFDGTLQGFKAITSEDNHILSATASRTYPLTLQNLYFRPRTCPGNYSPSKCDGMHTCIVTDQETHGRGSHGSEKSSGEFQGLGATSHNCRPAPQPSLLIRRLPNLRTILLQISPHASTRLQTSPLGARSRLARHGRFYFFISRIWSEVRTAAVVRVKTRRRMVFLWTFADPIGRSR